MSSIVVICKLIGYNCWRLFGGHFYVHFQSILFSQNTYQLLFCNLQSGTLKSLSIPCHELFGAYLFGKLARSYHFYALIKFAFGLTPWLFYFNRVKQRVLSESHITPHHMVGDLKLMISRLWRYHMTSGWDHVMDGGSMWLVGVSRGYGGSTMWQGWGTTGLVWSVMISRPCLMYVTSCSRISCDWCVWMVVVGVANMW